MGISTMGSVFWVALTIVADGRKSQTANITFTVTQQDYRKCI